MISIIKPSKLPHRRDHRSRRGTTIAETMVALTLSSLILGGISSSYIFLLKCTASIGNYVDMNQTSRHGLEVFARDARMASRIFAMESNTFIFIADTESGPRLITYIFDSESMTVKRRVGLEWS